MATYAIGDLQGCYRELRRLLDHVRFSDADRLWLCGDLVNRGPQSLEVLRFVRSLGERATVVLGNHDLHLLAVAWRGEKKNRKDTLDGILTAPDRDELLHWLRHQPLFHHDAECGYAMAHAGVPPAWTLEQAGDYAAEVETVLRARDEALLRDYFGHMYGNEPARWDDSLDGWPRLRLITNYLTRMRFCDADSTLELTTKTGPQAPPPGFAPWYSLTGRRDPGTRLLFGHWASLEGRASAAGVYALDTGCVWGGPLTALRLEDQARFCVESPGYA
ncbi:symmetrical bis(5'-nucleosyl)-tetraphosphatase [Motiliproteus sp. SC1-56]|uniref:symmetrical bis(5'-nucleosyl)-tetraphosphatase n=1 Tax=Motiliproteus sp. SC1-56 TaxID=2799565 RepID=UPI001A9097E9|nr:symmetrical bis(5'-nucleosyl)-tetraphosphatase [Motiliproteus sp. SC1-56]